MFQIINNKLNTYYLEEKENIKKRKLNNNCLWYKQFRFHIN